MLGLGTRVQALPFQRSTRVAPPTPPPVASPTAKQNDVDRQETPFSPLVGRGLGEGRIDHGPTSTVRGAAAGGAPLAIPAAIPTEPATTASETATIPNARFIVITFRPQI